MSVPLKKFWSGVGQNVFQFHMGEGSKYFCNSRGGWNEWTFFSIPEGVLLNQLKFGKVECQMECFGAMPRFIFCPNPTFKMVVTLKNKVKELTR